MHSFRKLAWLLGGSLWFATACGDDDPDPEPSADAAPQDAGTRDGSVGDAGADARADGGGTDAASADGGNIDAAAGDSGMDASTPDAAPADSAAPNDASSDSAAPNDASSDSAAPNDASSDSAAPNDASSDDAAPSLSDAQTIDASGETDAEPDGAPGDAQADGPVIESNFDNGAEGWKIGDNAPSGDTDADYVATGGNPGGYIQAVDAESGLTWSFVAPASYWGNRSYVLGRILSFDLKTSAITDPFSTSEVAIESPDLALFYDASPDPSTDWTHYTVLLSAQGWRANAPNGPDATNEQLQHVLSNLSGISIRGEFNLGADTGGLDNVKFGVKP